MAHIAITFVDQPDGLVDIQVFLGDIVEGAAPTPAQKLASAMLKSAKEESEITDVDEWPRARLLLSEADSLADLAGTPRPERN